MSSQSARAAELARTRSGQSAESMRAAERAMQPSSNESPASTANPATCSDPAPSATVTPPAPNPTTCATIRAPASPANLPANTSVRDTGCASKSGSAPDAFATLATPSMSPVRGTISSTRFMRLSVTRAKPWYPTSRPWARPKNESPRISAASRIENPSSQRPSSARRYSSAATTAMRRNVPARSAVESAWLIGGPRRDGSP